MFKKFWEWLSGLFSPKNKTSKEVDLATAPASIPAPIGSPYTNSAAVIIMSARCMKGESITNIPGIRDDFFGPPANLGKGNWASCAATVYWAVKEAGLDIPVMIPGSWASFAYVPEIWKWAKKNGLYQRNYKGFVPPFGAWAIIEWGRKSYEATDYEGDENHVEMVRGYENGMVLTAGGNVGGKNGLFQRNPVVIVGYVVIPDHYSFELAKKQIEVEKPVVKITSGRVDLSKGLELIKEFEGCRLKAYPDPGTGGEPWTIGWGHTGSDVYPGKVISQKEADELFEKDMQKFIDGVAKLVKVPMSNGQYGALVSFAYNCGLGSLGSSSLLKYFNIGKIQEAADQFPLWNKAAGKVLAGLVRRRKAERELFLS